MFCDVDGVVADLMTPWLKEFNTRVQPEHHVDFAHAKEWDVTKMVHPSLHSQILALLRDERIYLAAEPLPGALEGLAALRELGVRVTFATATSPAVALARARWLQEHQLIDEEARELIYVQDKSLLRGDILLDDNPANLAAFHGERWLFNRHFNRDHDVPECQRLMGWPHVVERMKARSAGQLLT